MFLTTFLFLRIDRFSTETDFEEQSAMVGASTKEINLSASIFSRNGSSTTDETPELTSCAGMWRILWLKTAIFPLALSIFKYKAKQVTNLLLFSIISIRTDELKRKKTQSDELPYTVVLVTRSWFAISCQCNVVNPLTHDISSATFRRKLLRRNEGLWTHGISVEKSHEYNRRTLFYILVHVLQHNR